MSTLSDDQPLVEYGTSPTMVCDWLFIGILDGDSIELGEEWTGTMQEADRESRRRVLAYENETGIVIDCVHLHQRSRWRERKDEEAK